MSSMRIRMTFGGRSAADTTEARRRMAVVMNRKMESCIVGLVRVCLSRMSGLYNILRTKTPSQLIVHLLQSPKAAMSSAILIALSLITADPIVADLVLRGGTVYDGSN